MHLAFLAKLRLALGIGKRCPRGPVHGRQDQPRDLEYLFRKRGYPGSRDRRYLVHLPPAYFRGGARLPVVMILHGCEQNHEDVRHVADFDRLADQHGVIVVYPFVTSYERPRLNNCWAFWSRRHNRAGAGEVEDLWQILCDVRRRFGADENRLHVAGLSSGGSMAVALLVNRCDKIASGAEIAGLSYSEIAPIGAPLSRAQKPLARIVDAMERQMANRKRRVPLLIVHSSSDPIIHVSAADKLRESWASSFAIEMSKPIWSRSGKTRGTAWVHKRFRCNDGAPLLETLLLDHKGHGWYGGKDGRFGFADAPNVSKAIWRFFQAHTL